MGACDWPAGLSLSAEAAERGRRAAAAKPSRHALSMFSIEEFPEEPPPSVPAPRPPRDPPESPWGGSPGSSPAGTPTEPPGGGGGSDSGDPPAFRGRSRSAPPVLWAARKYGRELRRMSDEFQLQVLPRPTSVGGAPKGRWGGPGGWREALRAWWGRHPPRPAPP